MSRPLTISKSKIDRAIVLASAFAAKRDELMPPANGLVDVVDLIKECGPKMKIFEATAEYGRFHEFLVGLTSAEMRELQALMYLGRGDWSPKEFWSECDRLPMDVDPNVEAQHVMEKAPFVDYVSDGFEVLNQNRIV